MRCQKWAIVLEMWPNYNVGFNNNDYLPSPGFNTSVNEIQDHISLCRCCTMLFAHVQLIIHQYSQDILAYTAIKPGSPLPSALLLHLIFPFVMVEYHSLGYGPMFKPMNDDFAFECINQYPQPDVTCKSDKHFFCSPL